MSSVFEAAKERAEVESIERICRANDDVFFLHLFVGHPGRKSLLIAVLQFVSQQPHQ